MSFMWATPLSSKCLSGLGADRGSRPPARDSFLPVPAVVLDWWKRASPHTSLASQEMSGFSKPTGSELSVQADSLSQQDDLSSKTVYRQLYPDWAHLNGIVYWTVAESCLHAVCGTVRYLPLNDFFVCFLSTRRARLAASVNQRFFPPPFVGSLQSLIPPFPVSQMSNNGGKFICVW